MTTVNKSARETFNMRLAKIYRYTVQVGIGKSWQDEACVKDEDKARLLMLEIRKGGRPCRVWDGLLGIELR